MTGKAVVPAGAGRQPVNAREWGGTQAPTHEAARCGGVRGGRTGVIQRRATGDGAATGAVRGIVDVDELGHVLDTPGRELPPAVRADMEQRLGSDFSTVRIHSGDAAHRSAVAVGARAWTAGSHIVFRDGLPDTGTRAGRMLLAHELAHVVQQSTGPVAGRDIGGGLRVSEPGDRFEREAEAVADRAERTGPRPGPARPAPTLPPAPAGIRAVQRFEAPVHEAAERVGLTTDAAGREDQAAFSNEEAGAVYFGNWMRDLNQVFVPLALRILPADVLFSMLAYMAAKKFGRSMTPEQFGYYIPAEHIDNPGGLTSTDDLLAAPPAVTAAPPVAGAPARPPAAVTAQEPPEPAAAVQQGAPGTAAPVFSVDRAGVLAYIRRTNLHVERRLELAVQRGRTTDGLLHFGAALHAVEDLFAHSNWVEIAVNKVLREHADLLPRLRGADRSAFAFLPSIDVGRGPAALRNRPVLSTGTFLGADTKISLTSEFVKFLLTPLPDPKTIAEAKSEERFIEAELRVTGHLLQNNKQFRDGLRQTLLGALGSYGRPPYSAVTGRAVETLLSLPMDQIYHLGTLLPAIIPQSVRDVTVVAAQRAIRAGIHEHLMVPAAKRFQAEALGAQVADTSLIVALREARARQARTATPEAERRAMELEGRFTGRGVAEQEREGREAAVRRERNLQATPEPTIAGPSHSQIAKDHADSPFFGLAFKVATVADRRLRERITEAWAEAGGGPTRRLGFDAAAWPAGTEAEREQRDLFLQTRARRDHEETESRAAGLRIAARGNVEPAAFDLAAMRTETAERIRAVAALLRATAGAPDQVGGRLQQLRGWLGTVAPDDPELAKIDRELQTAADAARQAGQGRTAVSTAALADQLDADAAVVAAALTQPQRQAAHEQLDRSRATALRVLATTPDLRSGTAGVVLLVLDQQIADTAPTFYTEQREVAEGRRHLAEHTGPRTFALREVTLPALSSRPPGLRHLLEESRLLVDHPYESTWWEQTVIEHIRAHADQIATDIAARSSGVPVLRRTGQTREARRHEQGDAP
ncbi:DUF4157 domain-containing protein [Kitasatospora sp. NPDC058218]|uniref:eCIS core domain-containing protein n=1 Tax=Kitasatospora sp. NPDC058218 TaxID=3346385 RepID=UPI0036DCCEE2